MKNLGKNKELRVVNVSTGSFSSTIFLSSCERDASIFPLKKNLRTFSVWNSGLIRIIMLPSHDATPLSVLDEFLFLIKSNSLIDLVFYVNRHFISKFSN